MRDNHGKIIGTCQQLKGRQKPLIRVHGNARAIDRQKPGHRDKQTDLYNYSPYFPGLDGRWAVQIIKTNDDQ